jgi:hypothetical protein
MSRAGRCSRIDGFPSCLGPTSGFRALSFHETVNIFRCLQLDVLAAIKCVEADLDSFPQALQLQVVDVLAMLKHAQGFADDVAGVRIATGTDRTIDKLVEVFGERDLADWHGQRIIS